MIDLLSNQGCLWNVKSENYRNRTIQDKTLEELAKELNFPDLTEEDVKLKIKYNLTNIHIFPQLPAQFHLPPFWNRLPGSLLWNRTNSIAQPLNSISLIQSCWSSWGPCNRAFRNVALTHTYVLTSRFSPVLPSSKWLCHNRTLQWRRLLGHKTFRWMTSVNRFAAKGWLTGYVGGTAVRVQQCAHAHTY